MRICNLWHFLFACAFVQAMDRFCQEQQTQLRHKQRLAEYLSADNLAFFKRNIEEIKKRKCVGKACIEYTFAQKRSKVTVNVETQEIRFYKTNQLGAILAGSDILIMNIAAFDFLFKEEESAESAQRATGD